MALLPVKRRLRSVGTSMNLLVVILLLATSTATATAEKSSTNELTQLTSSISASKISFSLQDIPLHHRHGNNQLFEQQEEPDNFVPYLLAAMLIISAVMLASLSSSPSSLEEDAVSYLSYCYNGRATKAPLPLHLPQQQTQSDLPLRIPLRRRRSYYAMDTIDEECAMDKNCL